MKKSVCLILLLAGLVMAAVGVYTGFFESRGFEKASAVITRIEKERDYASDDTNAMTHTAIVTYTVGEKEYTEALDQYIFTYKAGKTIGILYDPANPAKIHADSPVAAAGLIAAGGLTAAAAAYMFLKRR